MLGLDVGANFGILASIDADRRIGLELACAFGLYIAFRRRDRNALICRCYSCLDRRVVGRLNLNFLCSLDSASQLDILASIDVQGIARIHCASRNSSDVVRGVNVNLAFRLHSRFDIDIVASLNLYLVIGCIANIDERIQLNIRSSRDCGGTCRRLQLAIRRLRGNSTISCINGNVRLGLDLIVDCNILRCCNLNVGSL